MKTPNIWEFPQKLHSLSILCAEYSKNSGHLMQFFQKIGKFKAKCLQIQSSFLKTWKIKGKMPNILVKWLHYLWLFPNIRDTRVIIHQMLSIF